MINRKDRIIGVKTFDAVFIYETKFYFLKAFI